MMADGSQNIQPDEPVFVEHVPSPETDEKAFARLAAMPPAEYDRSRQAEAERMGIRVSTLDSQVEKLRVGADVTKGRALTLPLPQPWPDPVQLSDVLDDLADAIGRHVILADAARYVVALWCAHTWVFKRFDHTPRLAIKSPQKRCGKSTLLDTTAAVCRSPLKADNISASGVFRVVEALSPTVFLDEADTYLANSEELRGVLNSGFEQSGAVIRVVEIQGEHTPVQFCTFAPVLLAGIGRIPETLEDRAVPIQLERKLADQTVIKLRAPGARAALGNIARKLARWAQDDAHRLNADPVMPDELNDREADISVPLVAIADLAGQTWAARGRSALLTLFRGRAQDEDAAGTGTLLLADIQAIFKDTRLPHLLSAELAERLGKMGDAPWSAWRQDKPITALQLARALKPYRIRPKNIKQPGTNQVLKGYSAEAFAEAWERYLSSKPPLSEDNGGDEVATRYSVENISELSENGTATLKSGSGYIFGKTEGNACKVAGSDLKHAHHRTREYMGGVAGNGAAPGGPDEVEL